MKAKLLSVAFIAVAALVIIYLIWVFSPGAGAAAFFRMHTGRALSGKTALILIYNGGFALF